MNADEIKKRIQKAFASKQSVAAKRVDLHQNIRRAVAAGVLPEVIAGLKGQSEIESALAVLEEQDRDLYQ